MKKRTAVVTILMAICMIMTIIGFVGCKDDGGGETPDPVRNVTLSQTQVTLDRYENITLTATVTDEAGNAVSDAVTWATSNAAVATVSGGFVQATGEGSADITASVGAAKATCKVTVESSGMEPVLSLDAESVSVVVGGEFTVRGAVMYNRVEQTDAVITYTMADTSIATVDGEGSITGVSYGSTTLTVSASWRGVESSFLTEQIPVTVKENISLTITGENATIYLKNTTVEDEVFSNTVTYTGTVLVAGSEDDVDKSKIAWKSSDETVATVKDGVVTATGDKEGSVQITMTYTGEEVYSSAPVTVTVAMPTLDKTDEITLYLDANAADKTVGGQITAAEVFGSDTDKTIERIADADNTATDISDNATWITERDTGSESARTYTLAVYNDEYGCLVNAVVATKVITTYTELTQMQEYGGVQSVTTSANKTYYNYSGYFVLGNDIVVQSSDPVFEVDCVTGFGSQVEMVAANGFSGTFNGNGHTIYNLRANHSGLLGDIASGSVIKNVAFVNATVTSDAGDNGGAGVIGFSAFGTTIENVFISMSTSAARSGMVGRIMAGGAIRNSVIYYEKTGGYFCGALTSWTSSAVTAENVYVIYSTTTAEADRTLKGEPDQPLQLSGTVTEYGEEELASAEFSGLPAGWYVAEGGYPMFESSIGGMYISQTTLTGTVGGQGSLQGYVYGASQSDDLGLPVVWESDNPDAVEVSQTGAYEFVGEGSATITVTYGKFTATCEVTVEEPSVPITDITETMLDVESNSTTGLGTQIVNAGGEAGLLDTFTPTAVYFESAPDTDYNDDYGTETGFFATYDTGNETARTLTLIVANGDTTLYRVKVLVVTKIITTYDELAALQSYTEVTEGKANETAPTYYSYDGYFVLANNLVATGEEAAFAAPSMGSISSSVHANNLAGFHGTFDGRGYTVSGFKYATGGIFGDVGRYAVIKNVAFINCTVGPNAESGSGVLAANANGATVENVLITATVSARFSGAMFGRSSHSCTIDNSVIRFNAVTEGLGTPFNIGAVSSWTVYNSTLHNSYIIYDGSVEQVFGNTTTPTFGTGTDVHELKAEEIATTSFTGLSDTYWTVTAGEMPTFNSMADIESA